MYTHFTRSTTLSVATAIVAFLLADARPVEASSHEAYTQVRDAIEAFDEADFATASERLAEAAKTSPDDKRIAFDAACALAASGETDAAVEQFRDAALAEDNALVAEAYYNLGGLFADDAKQQLGDDPVNVEKGVREPVVKRLGAAMREYRTCLDVAPDHEPARHNLEVVRHALRSLEEAWTAKDRHEKYEAMDLNALLEHIDAQERSLRADSRRWNVSRPTIKQRLETADAAKSQAGLVDAIEPLKAKIPEAFSQATQGAPGASPMGGGMPGMAMGAPQGMTSIDPETLERKTRAMIAMADRAGEAMRTAAESLDVNRPGQAVFDEEAVIERIDGARVVMTPFADLVHRAVDHQQTLVDDVAAALQEPTANDNASTPIMLNPKQDEAAAETVQPPKPLDAENASFEQRFVPRWAKALVEKAQEDLPDVEQQLAQMPPAPPTDEPDASEELATDENADEAMSPEEQQRQQMRQQREHLESMKAALEKAIENGPAIETSAGDASASLQANDATTAAPHQQEALRLLKEIEDLLPKNPQDQQQDQQQNDQQQQQSQDNESNEDQQQDEQQQSSDGQDDQEQKQNDEKSGAGNEEEQQQDESQGDQDESDQQQQDQQPGDQDESEGDEQQREQPQPSQVGEQEAQPISAEEVEAMLRRVRQREQHGREVQKAIEIYMENPRKVEKDW